MDEPREVHVLLIEEEPAHAREVERALAAGSHAGSPADRFVVERVDGVNAALKAAGAREFDVAILDIASVDRQKMQPIEQVHRSAPDLPLVILTATDDEELAVAAAQNGAQDYITRSELAAGILPRALCYAVERHRLQRELQRRSIVDELTGLYNRRGFFMLAEQEIKRAKRCKQPFLLVFADLDGLKEANDRYGHEEGDLLIISAARVLTQVFRDSDIVARLGGDEFAVIAHAPGEEAPAAIELRLTERLEEMGARVNTAVPLSMSIGLVAYDPEEPESLDALLSRADSVMYRNKKNKRN